LGRRQLLELGVGPLLLRRVALRLEHRFGVVPLRGAAAGGGGVQRSVLGRVLVGPASGFRGRFFRGRFRGRCGLGGFIRSALLGGEPLVGLKPFLANTRLRSGPLRCPARFLIGTSRFLLRRV
jgi:hypothetical protein